MGMSAKLQFTRAKEGIPVRLRIREARLVIQGKGKRRSCMIQEDVELEREDVIEEVLPGGSERERKKKGTTTLLDEETGRGTAGLKGALEALAAAMSQHGLVAEVGIGADLHVPVGLVMEAYRRASTLENVVGVNFLGHMDPLIGLDTPVFRPDKKPVVRANESLQSDPSDKCPVFSVAFDAGALHVETPFPPKSGAAEYENAFEGLEGLMKAFAAGSRDSKDPRLSTGWLDVGLPAEAPSALIWWVMQEAVKPGAGIWKIRVRLPGGHAYCAED
jgi:hypothetical protein